MKFRTVMVLAVGTACAVFMYLQVHKERSTEPVSQTSSVGDLAQSGGLRPRQVGSAQSHSNPTIASADDAVAPDATSAAKPVAAPPPSAAVPVPETAESSSLPAETVLENLRVTIHQYASTFGENPVGTNPEITGALQGDNPKHVNFLRADGNRVNSKGEMVDVWGTPYFFHQISGHEMEIRSAGPDRVMYTHDDLLTK